MKEIGTGPDYGGDLIIPIEKVPVEAFQAIYHHLTQKTEVLNKQYAEVFAIDANAVSDFHYHFQQAVASYHIKASNSEVVLSLTNGEVHRISSVERFAAVNWSAFSAATNGLDLTYDFLVVPPRIGELEDVSQRFRATLSIKKERPEYEVIVSVGGMRNSRFVYIIESSIEYADVSVARALQGIIDGWSARISFDDADAIESKWAYAISERAWYAIPLLMTLAIIGGLFFETPFEGTLTPTRYLLAVIVTTIVATGVGAYLSEKLQELGHLLAPRSYFQITRGDTANREQLQRKRRAAKKAIALLFCGVVVAGIVSFFVNVLSARVLGG